MDGNAQAASLLIVEDESIVAMDLAELLDEMGYAVCGIADNGADAIALTERHRPQLVLMDVVIKGAMDGIETARHIAHRFNAPVIFLTAYNDARSVERAAHTAPYGYVTKPFQAKELRAAIEVALYKAALERRLRESERWFALTLRCVGDGVVATDRGGRIRFLNPVAEKMLGWQLNDALGCPVEEVLPICHRQTGEALESPVRRTLRENVVVGIEFGTVAITRDGKHIPIDDSSAPIRGDNGEIIGAVVAFRDVTERLAMEETLRHSEQRFRAAFDFAPMGMALIGLGGQFLQVNAALCRLLGRSAEYLVGLLQTELTHPEDFSNEDQCLRNLVAGTESTAQFEKRFRHSSGKTLWCLASVSLLAQGKESLCFLYQIHDLTERKEAEYQLTRLAQYDTLTGLVNRARLMEEAELMLKTATRNGTRLAVVFMDLDRFKQVNDVLGHDAGDSLLREVAHRIKTSVREADCVGRLGGDEFVLLLPAINSAEDVAKVVHKINARIGVPLDLEGQEITVSTSLGASIFPEDGRDIRTLLKCADSALYHAKAQGRNNLQFYRSELTARVELKLQLDAELRRAIERGEFELHYQPYVPLTPGLGMGAEALCRWRHPTRGLIMPDEFIPYAEESGLISAIGDWVLLNACREAAGWPHTDGKAVSLAVNISARQFRNADFAQSIRQILSDTGLAPDRLCLELTEQTLVDHSEAVLSLMAELKALGVKIVIDDFGIGYSSLSYVKRFAPAKLKIDRTFIKDLAEGANDSAIVRAILAMSKTLGVIVVAEGVETHAQLRFLEEEGCDYVQGYLIARPCAAHAFREWLHQNATTTRTVLIG